MKCIGYIDASPPVGIDREVVTVAGFWLDPDGFQDVRERHAGPLCDIRPAFFTRQLSDLAARRVALKLGKRKRAGPRHHAVDREPPVPESPSLKPLERFIERRIPRLEAPCPPPVPPPRPAFPFPPYK